MCIRPDATPQIIQIQRGVNWVNRAIERQNDPCPKSGYDSPCGGYIRLVRWETKPTELRGSGYGARWCPIVS